MNCSRDDKEHIHPEDNFCRICGVRLKGEAAEGTTAFRFLPFIAQGDLKPEGYVRVRGKAGYFPSN